VSDNKDLFTEEAERALTDALEPTDNIDPKVGVFALRAAGNFTILAATCAALVTYRGWIEELGVSTSVVINTTVGKRLEDIVQQRFSGLRDNMNDTALIAHIKLTQVLESNTPTFTRLVELTDSALWLEWVLGLKNFKGK